MAYARVAARPHEVRQGLDAPGVTLTVRVSVVRFQPRSNGPLCEAIRGRFLLALDYGDGERIVEPYCHGLNRDNAEVLRAYQRSGPSRLGHRDPWRLFQMARASGIRVLAESFDASRSDYNERDPDIARIHCQAALHRSARVSHE